MAASLVAAAAGLLFGGLFQISRSQQLRQEQATVIQLLASRLALLDQVPSHEDSAGSFPTPHEAFSWHLQSQATPLPSLARVTYAITWQGKTLDVTTYRPMNPSDE